MVFVVVVVFNEKKVDVVGRLVGTFNHALVNSQNDGLACAVSVRAALVNKKKHGVVINLVFCLMDGGCLQRHLAGQELVGTGNLSRTDK